MGFRKSKPEIHTTPTCMTPLTFLLLLLGLWSSVHLIYRLHHPAHKSRDLLPISLTPRKRKSTTVTLIGPHLRIESTVFNAGHDTLAKWLGRSRNAGARAILRSVFDAGVVISLLGMVVALAVLAWTFVQLARRTAADFAPQSPQSADVYPYAKRAYDGNHVSLTLTARKPPDIPVQLLVCTVAFDLILNLHRLRYDSRTYQSRSPGSPFRCLTCLYSYARCSFRKLYTKQGMRCLLRCSFCVIYLRFLHHSRPRQGRGTATISRRILNCTVAHGFRRVSWSHARRFGPTCPRAHRWCRTTLQRTAVPRPPTPARAPIPPPWIFGYFRGRLVSNIRLARFAVGIPSPLRRVTHRARRLSACQR